MISAALGKWSGEVKRWAGSLRMKIGAACKHAELDLQGLGLEVEVEK